MKFCLKIIFFLIFFYLVENYEKSRAFFLDATSKIKKINFPKTLPISSLGNFTEFRDFQTEMLKIKVDRVQSKELFHLIDSNKDKIIQGYEWDDFYSLFITPFIKCDTNNDLFLSISEGKICIEKGEKFKNLISYTTQITDDIQSFLERIVNTFDLDRDGKLNLYDYVILRNFNNAYDILLVKEQKLYFKNFEVGLHMISKNL
jgi:hypothetical protein